MRSARLFASGRGRRMTPRQWLRLVLVGLGASVVPLDTAVNIGFPDITASFGLPIQKIQWVVICYVLTYASLMLAFGRVGDIFGHAPGVPRRAGVERRRISAVRRGAEPMAGSCSSVFCKGLARAWSSASPRHW